MTNPESSSWLDTAQQVSTEKDPAKLMVLVGRLCKELDRENHTTRRMNSSQRDLATPSGD